MRDNYQRIASAIRFLRDHYNNHPTLAETARHAGLSPYHLQRTFKQYTGISPKRFCRFLINREAKQYLAEGSDSLLATSEQLGLSNPSRLHDLMVSVDAVTPAEYRSKGRNLKILFGFHQTPFGLCLLATTSRGICSLAFVNGNRHQALDELQSAWCEAELYEDNHVTEKIINQIFFSKEPHKRLPLYLQGTNFQLKVWQALLAIPAGTVLSYSGLAALIGEAKASRAVGTAIGKNPIAYLIPCHRVLRSDGNIGGYRWGEERKIMILSRELVRN